MKKTVLLLSICALPAMASAQNFDKKLKTLEQDKNARRQVEEEK